MAPTINGNYDALAWVQEELQLSLDSALQSLNRYIDDDSDASALDSCITQLHQTNGTVEMLNLNGAALLSGEMLTSANALYKSTITTESDIQESLLKGLLLLKNYLGLLSVELQDHPLRLISSINELRSAREDSPLNDLELFKPTLSLQLPESIAPNPHRSKPTLSVSPKKLSPIFQLSLVRWFKGNDQESLQRIGYILNYLRLSSLQDRSIILWWTAAGVIEALLDNGLILTKEIKSKIGKLSKPIEILTLHDEQEFQTLFPSALVSELLLLIARTSSSGKHVTLLKDTFNLDFFNTAQHQQIYNFSGDALADVHSELLNDLQDIKEHIDQFDRQSEHSSNVIAQLPEQLSQMADTLQLLAENSSSVQLLQQQSKILTDLISQKKMPGDRQVIALADDLLQIESQLKNIRINTEHSTESLQLQHTVINECLSELSSVKNNLALLSDHPNSIDQRLEDISSQLTLVAGSLIMVNLNDAASLLQNTIHQITLIKENASSISQQELSWLAEIIASCELYMEGLQQGASQQSHLLINAQSILINFDQSYSNADLLIDETVTSSKGTTDATPVEIPNIESGVTRYINKMQQTQSETGVEQYINKELQTPTTTGVERYIQEQQNINAESGEIDSSSPSISSVERYIQDQASVVTIKTSVDRYIDKKAEEEAENISITDQLDDEIDPEIAEIFIEEANDVLAEFETLIPKWIQDHGTDTLTTIRRHFHTLKGSGRMAGAHVIAKLAWSIEHRLNTILEGSESITVTLDQLFTDSKVLIPDLLTRFTRRELSSIEQVDNLIELANNASTETEISLSDEEDELQQIFNIEAAQHLNMLKDSLEQAGAPFILNKELLRATHSLKGCANIAQVMPVAVVATQLDQTLRAFYEQNIALEQQPLSILTTIIDGLEQFVAKLKDPQSEQRDILSFAEQLVQMMPVPIEQHQDDEIEKRIDPEFLVVYLEETDELLSQYNDQLALLQQYPDNVDYQSNIHQTLVKLIDNAKHTNLPELVVLYQLLDRLTQDPEPNHKEIVSLIEQCYEHINDQIENLIQNKPSSDLSYFKQQVEQRLNHKVEEIDLFALPTDEPELLEAFTEEFAELLESSNDAIKRWRKNHGDNDATQQLQRVLHTIKGGARLTDLIPISDLAHQTESLVFLVADKKQDAGDSFFDLLQRSQDRLAEMQERLANKEALSFTHDLLADIAHFTGQTMPISVTASDLGIEHHVKTGSTGVEQIRVRADLLDFLTNFTGEVSISRDRVGQKNTAILQQLIEMDATVSRLQDQLRNLEIETETQILFRYEDSSQDKSDFDPLEFDRFSMIQQISRSLTESVSDMHEITQSIDNIVHDSDAILLQQSRLSADLEQGLMNTRLLPFAGLVPRFERIIRQVNSELNKQAELTVHGANRELDRTILDRIVAPIEHILRNAIAHGIESPEVRLQNNKPEIGQLNLSITREGSEILLSLSDDGQGINVEKVRQKALKQNLINPDKMPSDEELIQLILTSGFSTADTVSQISGRGVGMDVVSNEIRALKGRLSIQSIERKGTTFNIRLPLTLSIMQSLMVSCNDKPYAIPLSAVHAGTRATVNDIRLLLDQGNEARYDFNGEYYQFISLAQLLDQPLTLPDDNKSQLPILLFRYGDMHIALLVDAINSNREIVLKAVGEQLSHINSINGATILGDGQVVFILDIPSLVESTDLSSTSEIGQEQLTPATGEDTHNQTPIAMVVDDSITVRKVSSNLLKRHGFDVITARDGIDAIAQLNEQIPDIILLDVEMPRMDGYEFATLVRNIEQYQDLPIIMITSRTGDKHRDRALSIGVNAYLGKPYQELELVETMQKLLGNKYPDEKQ